MKRRKVKSNLTFDFVFVSSPRKDQVGRRTQGCGQKRISAARFWFL